MCKEKNNKIKSLFKYLIAWIEQVRPLHLVYSVFKFALINIISVTYLAFKMEISSSLGNQKKILNAILLI